jgi:hypothetical protein
MRCIHGSCILLVLSAFACNKPPGAPAVSITPALPGTADDLVASITADAVDPNDKDSVSYVYTWQQGSTTRTDLGSETVQSSLTTKGETWTVTVTPSDGKEQGEVGTASVTIANTAPVATLVLEPAVPLTTDDLVATASGSDDDDDTVTFAYTWTVNGAESSYAGDSVPASATERGEIWELTVVPNDGEDLGEAVTASVSIDNTAPTITAAEIAPVPAYETSTLAVTFESSDIDGDEVSARYAFYVNGSLAQEGDDATLSAEYFDRDQQVLAVITPSDGFLEGEPFTTDTIEISNSAPSYAAATVDPSEVYEDSTVSCLPSGWSDPDADPEGSRVTWFVEGVEVSTASTIDGASFDRGDELYCTITPDDGTDLGVPVTSDSVTVSNTAPSLDSVSLSTTSPSATDTVSVTLGSTTDADGDSITVSYSWVVNGSAVAAGPTLDGTRFDKGDVLYVVVTPNDGHDDGAPVTSETATVVNAPPIITSLLLSPSTLTTDADAVAATATRDDDGDPVSVSYAWTVDGSPVATSGDTISGVTWFDKGQLVSVVATPNDGEVDGAASSASATVANSPPSAPVLSVAPADPAAGEDDLFCEIDIPSSDADGDSVSYSFAWLVNGSSYSGPQTDDASSSLVPASETADAQTWTCLATPNDGEDDGTRGSEAVDIGPGGGDTCTYPSSSLSVSSGPVTGPTISPTYYSVDFIGTAVGEDIYDWASTSGDQPAYIEFEFYDSSVSSLCSVYYDLDGALPVAPTAWSTDTGGSLYQAWEITPVGGYTTCGPVSIPTWGTTDLRDLIELYDWGLAIGEMSSAMESSLSGAVGSDWSSDWAPYVSAGYVWSDLYGQATELEWVWLWEQDCGELAQDGGGTIKLSAPTGAPLDDAVIDGNGYYLFYASALVP